MIRWKTIGWKAVYACGCAIHWAAKRSDIPHNCREHGAALLRVRRVIKEYEADKRRRIKP